MPFTLSHPAAVMPLRRIRFLEPLALVIGSMLPDVPYFLPGALANRFGETHTLRGSIVTDLPLGVLLLVIVLLVRHPLVALLSEPSRHAEKDRARTQLASCGTVAGDRVLDAHHLGFVHA